MFFNDDIASKAETILQIYNTLTDNPKSELAGDILNKRKAELGGIMRNMKLAFFKYKEYLFWLKGDTLNIRKSKKRGRESE